MDQRLPPFIVSKTEFSRDSFSRERGRVRNRSHGNQNQEFSTGEEYDSAFCVDSPMGNANLAEDMTNSDRRLESDDDSVFEPDLDEHSVTADQRDLLRSTFSTATSIGVTASTSTRNSHGETSNVSRPTSLSVSRQPAVVTNNANIRNQSTGDEYLAQMAAIASSMLHPRHSLPAVNIAAIPRLRRRAQTINDPMEVVNEVARSLIDLSVQFEHQNAPLFRQLQRSLVIGRRGRSTSFSWYLSSLAGVASNLVSSTWQLFRQIGRGVTSSLSRPRSLGRLSFESEQPLRVSRSQGGRFSAVVLPSSTRVFQLAVDANSATSADGININFNTDRRHDAVQSDEAVNQDGLV